MLPAKTYRERLVRLLERGPKRPSELSSRAWWRAFGRTVGELIDDHLTDRAAVLTYYGILAIFPGMLVLVAAVPANAALNWALIFGHMGLPALGIAGSGSATTIVQWLILTVLAAMLLLAPRHTPIRLGRRMLRQMREILGLGLPEDQRVEADLFLLTDDEPDLIAGGQGLDVARSEEANVLLLDDLRSDRGMEWMPEDMWFTHLTLGEDAGDSDVFHGRSG